MIYNILPYNQQEFQNWFTTTELFSRIKADYDVVNFDRFWIPPTSKKSNNEVLTPRQAAAESETTTFSVVPFYYLKFLTDHAPKEIYDLGCGRNLFKKYLPNVIGIGEEGFSFLRGWIEGYDAIRAGTDWPICRTFDDFYQLPDWIRKECIDIHGLPDPQTVEEISYSDIYGQMDPEFVDKHQDYFESIFSINAIHFIPLSEIRQRVLDFFSMIKPGGHGFLALNLQRMLDQDQDTFNNHSLSDIENYVRIQLDLSEIEYQVIDIDFSVADEIMNGNIRLVMKK